MKEIPGTEFILPADLVLIAMGFLHVVRTRPGGRVGRKARQPRQRGGRQLDDRACPACSPPATRFAGRRWWSTPSIKAASWPPPWTGGCGGRSWQNDPLAPKTTDRSVVVLRGQQVPITGTIGIRRDRATRHEVRAARRRTSAALRRISYICRASPTFLNWAGIDEDASRRLATDAGHRADWTGLLTDIKQKPVADHALRQHAVLAFGRRTNAQPPLAVLMQDAATVVGEVLHAQVRRRGRSTRRNARPLGPSSRRPEPGPGATASTAAR